MLKNERRWILSCSCNAGKERYVKALGRNLDVDFDGLLLSKILSVATIVNLIICLWSSVVNQPLDVVRILIWKDLFFFHSS